MWKRDADTGLILRKAAGDSLCYTCCEVTPPPEDWFATDPYGCCCFRPPNPPAYSSGVTYNKYDCVAHNSKKWFSVTDGNLGHTPEEGANWWLYWWEYISCANSNWNSVPPFGGIGKTPKKYAIAVSKSIVTECDAHGESCDIACNHWVGSFSINYYIEAEYIGNQGCVWADGQADGVINIHGRPVYESGYCSLWRDYVIQKTHYARIFLGIDYTVIYFTTCTSSYESINVAGGCTIRGSYHNESWRWIIENEAKQYTTKDYSWRPLGSQPFSLWNNETKYYAGTYVAWTGKFWKCEKLNGPGTSRGVQDPTTPGTECWSLLE